MSIPHPFLASKPKSCRSLVFPQNATVKWLALMFLIPEAVGSNGGFIDFLPSHSRLIMGRYLKTDHFSSYRDHLRSSRIIIQPSLLQKICSYKISVNNLRINLIFPTRATYPAHHTLLHIITLTILGEECISWSSSCNFLHAHAPSCFEHPNIIFAPCFQTPPERRGTLSQLIPPIFFSTALLAHSGPRPLIQFRNHFSQTIKLLGRVISPSQGRYLNTGQHRHRINAHTHAPNIHVLSGILTHDPVFRASEGSSRLRPRGYRDRQYLQ
jgi:hypothetical protein